MSQTLITLIRNVFVANSRAQASANEPSVEPLRELQRVELAQVAGGSETSAPYRNW